MAVSLRARISRICAGSAWEEFLQLGNSDFSRQNEAQVASCDFCGGGGHPSSTCKKRRRFEKAAAAQQQQQQARVAEPAESSEVRIISF